MAINGAWLPMAYDGTRNKPSATLFFVYISFVMSMVSITYTFFKNEAYTPAGFSILLFVLCSVLYRIRRIDSLEVDLDDKSIKLKGGDAQQKESETK